MDNLSKPHIKLSGFTETLPYKYPRDSRGSQFEISERIRAIHGNILLNQLTAIQEHFEIDKDVEIPENIVSDDLVYVEFTSEWGKELKFESLDQDSIRKHDFQLLNVKREEREIDGEIENKYTATLLVKESGISVFIGKINEYLTENIFQKDKTTGERIDTGNAKNYPLINNIQSIQLATLKAFWTDAPEISFPDTEASIWWEVWFRKTADDAQRMARAFQNLQQVGCIIGAAELELVEHRVKLIKGTTHQLAQSLLLLDNLAELRKPQETAGFINHKDVTYIDKQEYLADLIARTESNLDENSVLICLLDSGVNNGHPLLAAFLPDGHRYAYKAAWGKGDGAGHGGHGTGVASIALYGDLIEAIDSQEQIQIAHGLESCKISNDRDPNDPPLYAAITEEAMNAPIVDRPNNLRVYCMTITDEHLAFKGRPSSWSAAVDKIAFGTSFEPKYQQIFIVSSGNVWIDNHDEYPAKNVLESIHDPAQAYNAITVGTYTRKNRIDINTGLSPLAPNGGMSPSNSTSLLWDPQWPNKPDFVMEGGNSSTDGVFVSHHESLKLLAADAEFPNFIFCPFGDSSAAAGLAAKMAAELRIAYPDFWPETIRGLMIHSADWTNAMLDGRLLSTLREPEKRSLLRTYGYGVPNLGRAIHSANNSLTLIAERQIQPYKKERYAGQYNDYHLFDLPWPVDVLHDLQETDATLTITLSYYIEPNPGAKRYSNNFHYHSHSLDFSVIKPGERLEVFKRRISALSELAEDERNNNGEPWVIGRSGSKGSIRKDFITMSAIDMSERNKIAVYPKNGWYKTRKKLQKFDEIVRYSLIVSIKTEGADIYTPVFTLVENANLLF